MTHEIRYATDDDGTVRLDEVFARGASVHLETMDRNCWLLILEWPDGKRVDVTLYTKRATIWGRAEVDSEGTGRGPLPVIATCGMRSERGVEGAGSDSGRCYHSDAPSPAIISGDAPPPAWCPLRGKP